MAGLVYAVGGEGTSLIKLGRTTNRTTRHGALQAYSPVRLRILWERPGGSAVEAGLHRVFADRRRHYEWFEFEGIDDPVDAIDKAYTEWMNTHLRGAPISADSVDQIEDEERDPDEHRYLVVFDRQQNSPRRTHVVFELNAEFAKAWRESALAPASSAKPDDDLEGKAS